MTDPNLLECKYKHAFVFLVQKPAEQPKPPEPAKPAEAKPAEKPKEPEKPKEEPKPVPAPAKPQEQPPKPAEAKPPAEKPKAEPPKEPAKPAEPAKPPAEPAKPAAAPAKATPAPKADIFGSIFYFSGMGSLLGSALAEGVYVPESGQRTALDSDAMEAAYAKRRAINKTEQVSLLVHLLACLLTC